MIRIRANGFISIKTLIILIQVFCLNFACQKKEIITEDKSYAFFVAGHVYGNPATNKIGLYSEFKNRFPYIVSHPHMQFGVFTGDIVKTPSEKSWDAVDADIEDLGLNILFAVGNHDMKDRELYEERYGSTYYDTIIKGDLFIILDPNIDHWNISGDQLQFLKRTVSKHSALVNNIFVFFHQLIWIDHPNYKKVRPNSFDDKADTLNFWTEIEPIFHNIDLPVYFYAGDIGAVPWSDDFMFDRYDNITLIASGMGEGKGDNIIVVRVDEYQHVDNKIIALQGEIYSLGEIEDYILP